MSDSITEVYAPLQVGVQYKYNKSITDDTITCMNILLSNFTDIFGGANGKVSPVVAKYVTSNISLLSSGSFADIHCSMLMNDGVDDLAFKNEWIAADLDFYNNLKNYSQDLIEVESYYSYISSEVSALTTASIDYSEIISLLLAQGDNILDSDFVTVLRLYNLNSNYLLMIKHILIVSIRIYTILAAFINNQEKISMSLLELDTLLNNIHYVSSALELYDVSIRPIPLIKEVRKLQLAIQNVRGTVELFNNHERVVE